MDQKLLELKQEALVRIDECPDLNKLNELRVEYLGKKGFLSGLSSKMGQLQPSERAEFGKKINDVKNSITSSLDSKKVILEEKVLKEKLEKESIDITLPGSNYKPGSKHIINMMIDEISEICLGLGFEIADRPEIEENKYNFELLNLPKNHPQRDMQNKFSPILKFLLINEKSMASII